MAFDGGVYALLGLGLSLTFGCLKRLNLAYGATAMLAAYMGAWCHLRYQVSIAVVAITTATTVVAVVTIISIVAVVTIVSIVIAAIVIAAIVIAAITTSICAILSITLRITRLF